MLERPVPVGISDMQADLGKENLKRIRVCRRLQQRLAATTFCGKSSSTFPLNRRTDIDSSKTHWAYRIRRTNSLARGFRENLILKGETPELTFGR
jgi:hypothetical protein